MISASQTQRQDPRYPAYSQAFSARVALFETAEAAKVYLDFWRVSGIDDALQH